MQSFKDFTTNTKPRHNLHLDHVDETLFIGGDSGASDALDLLESPYFITQKFDGAPSIFCGTDPADGKFFVGTKSVFNKNPKLYKESWDIIENEPAGKATKLIEALKWLSQLNIPSDTVLQGDLLWTSGDHVYETYEGKRYVTVHPNTLVYGWLAESDAGKVVRNAQLGIVFHTTYRGQNDLQNYSATFGANVDNLRQVREVWVRDARYTADFSLSESDRTRLELARELIGSFDRIVANESVIPSQMVGTSIKTYVNNFVRFERDFSEMTVNDYREFVASRYTDAISNLVTESAIDRKKVQVRSFNEQVNVDREAYDNAFEFVYLVQQIKNRILGELNKNNEQVIFVKTADGLQEADTEGYVFVGHNGNGVKVVDRKKFSHYNFSENYVKGWQKSL